MRLLATVCLAVLSLPFARAEAIIINEDRLFPHGAYIYRLGEDTGQNRNRSLTVDAKFQGDTELGTLTIDRWNVLDGDGNVVYAVAPRTLSLWVGSPGQSQTHVSLGGFLTLVRMREWPPSGIWGEWWVNMVPPSLQGIRLTLPDPAVPNSPPQQWLLRAMVASPNAIPIGVPEPTAVSLAATCLAVGAVRRRLATSARR